MDNTLTPVQVEKWPDHTELPCEDGTIVENFQEHPQGMLLTDSFVPIARQLYPDGQYAIGMDSGIYFRRTDPPLLGVKAPDWFLVPGVPPVLDGLVRRSYVMWQERVRPLILLEYVSRDGSEERDRTPQTGKFWVYEHEIQPEYYGIYEVNPGRIEMYHLVDGHFERMEPNERGRYFIEPLGLELGIWKGLYSNYDLPWMRWWDAAGNLLLTGWEFGQQQQQQTEQEKQRAEQEKQRAEQEKQRAEQLAEKLRALGVDPNTI